ncbi:hypothetical protein PVAND_010783 [Polypedilum vanderplanki]|uniref:Aminopeptidase n=1 Tax=Polypedilum vanderplanki TaxID=319348 RepID=A0A9J6CGL6_POLVA|nr:hypothetical protein PVAND_010783 [Polypedilum vanderplanki]
MLKIFYLIFFVLLSSVKCENEFELPQNILPTSYEIHLTFSSDLTNQSYNGIVKLCFTTLEKVSEIKLHSYGHEVNSTKIYKDYPNFEFITEATEIIHENEHIIKLNLTEELEENEHFIMLISFVGNVSSMPYGLFRSECENENEEIEWQIASNLKQFKAHYAFPCFDDPKYRATFNIPIIHNQNHTAFFNMKEWIVHDHGNELVQTNFLPTPLISPSSLAFFISDFLNESKNIESIENTIVIRESQVEKTQIFFDAIGKLLVIVESFMNFNLTFDTLHHVMLPDYESDIESFYGFNYYREHLILFNPAISPQTKEFSIHRMITAGLVSQYLTNIVSFASYNDGWIFNGIIKFLEYYIRASDSSTDNSDNFRWQKVQFINDVLADAITTTKNERVTERAASIFYMIYNAIGEKAFTVALQQFIADNAFKTITVDKFYETLQANYEEFNLGSTYGNLRETIEGFMNYQKPLVVTVVVNADNILYILKPNITMPMTYKTSYSSNISEIFWSEQDAVSKTLENHDWILFNVDRLGFYRVNYNENNWKNLISAIDENRNLFSDMTISQLIDDSLNLARDSLLSYHIVFDLLEIMTLETSYNVWNAAVRNLLELNNRINGLDIHEKFMEFVNTISNKYVEEIGFDDPSSDESLERKFSRLQMIDIACQMNSNECLEFTHSKLVLYLDDGEPLSVNLEEKILCYGLLSPFKNDNGTDYFNKIKDKLHASKDVEYRLRIISSLGCYPDREILIEFLNSTVENDGKFKASEYLHTLRSMYTKSNEGIDAVLTFLENNFEIFIAKSKNKDIIEIIIKEIARKIFNDELAVKFTNLLENLNIDNDLTLILLSQISENIDWRKSSSVNQIRTWFQRNIETTIEPTEESTTTELETTENTTIETTSEDITDPTTTDSSGKNFGYSFEILLFIGVLLFLII